MNLGAQLGPMSITKLSPNWARQMGPIHCPKFLLSGILLCLYVADYYCFNGSRRLCFRCSGSLIGSLPWYGVGYKMRIRCGSVAFGLAPKIMSNVGEGRLH